ncbi:hypothetical protein [Nostoc sp. 106C]|nr:hypothetical protein [Nostoc sp. 106C]
MKFFKGDHLIPQTQAKTNPNITRSPSPASEFFAFLLALPPAIFN